MTRSDLHRNIILITVLAVTAVFLYMVRSFLMAILLAGIFSALAQPLFRGIDRLTGGRKNLSSLLTVLILLLMVILPLAGLLGIVASQAIKISSSIKPWIDQWASSPGALEQWTQTLPFAESLRAYRGVILQKAGELVGTASSFLFSNLSSLTLATINFIFLFFVFLYTMFFFLKEGRLLLDRIVLHVPLPGATTRRMLDKFTSVTRATVKGTLVIGVIQGGLAGLGFWAAGIESALFWATIMSVMSVIPSIGTSLIWIPAVIILAVSGHIAKAVGLLLFCALVVGSIDNLLRPWLVGRDTQLHELMIFFGTLGGISLFGIMGFIVGPIIASLFVTVWDIYGETFTGSPGIPDNVERDGCNQGSKDHPG